MTTANINGSVTATGEQQHWRNNSAGRKTVLGDKQQVCTKFK